MAKNQYISFNGIGGTTGGPTGDFQLVVPVKTDTGDPTGVAAGAIYYNSFDDALRLFDGAVWRNVP